MANQNNEATSLSDLLDLDVDTLTATSPAPADDPLSLVREEQEVQPDVEGIPADAPAALKNGDVVTFHVIVPQFYILDRLFREGDQITLVVGQGPYARTVDDRTGRSWVEDLHDPEAMEFRWGKVPFAPGPAPDRRLNLIQVPKEVPADLADLWKASVLAAADEMTRNR